MIFTGRFARDLIIAVVGAVVLSLAINGLSKRDHKFAGTASSSQEHPSVVTDDCGAAAARGCRADFLFHMKRGAND